MGESRVCKRHVASLVLWSGFVLILHNSTLHTNHFSSVYLNTKEDFHFYLAQDTIVNPQGKSSFPGLPQFHRDTQSNKYKSD